MNPLNSEDFIDHLAAYGVTRQGKQGKRESFNKKFTNSISFKVTIERAIIGTSTALVVLNEVSEYKMQGKFEYLKGKTFYLLEFNE